MSATNATTNYELPVFIATDKPAWLVDWNGAMNAIDSAIKEAKTAGDNAQSTANTNANNISTLDGTVTSQGTAIGNLQTAVSGNTGSINTINSLIGNGEPTTSDKTLIGAINEINAKVGDVAADDVSFDPTGTSLVATNVEAAIKEVAAGAVTPDADDVAYDNTTSHLVATNVQAAIDEVNGKIVGSQYDFDLNTNVQATLALHSDATGLTISPDYSGVKVLTNADSSIGKIYGGMALGGSITYTGSAEWRNLVVITASNLPTVTEAYNIEFGWVDITVGADLTGALGRLHFNTDGTVVIQAKIAAATITNFRIGLCPCIYFLKDLGD